jgi:hypothetical protein
MAAPEPYMVQGLPICLWKRPNFFVDDMKVLINLSRVKYEFSATPPWL